MICGARSRKRFGRPKTVSLSLLTNSFSSPSKTSLSFVKGQQSVVVVKDVVRRKGDVRGGGLMSLESHCGGDLLVTKQVLEVRGKTFDGQKVRIVTQEINCPQLPLLPTISCAFRADVR